MGFLPHLFDKLGKSVIHLPTREMYHDSSFNMKENFEDRKKKHPVVMVFYYWSSILLYTQNAIFANKGQFYVCFNLFSREINERG